MGAPSTRLSLDEYLAWENEQVERHEFHRGEVFAVVGTNRTHACVVMNLSRALGNALAGTRCHDMSESTALEFASVDCRMLLEDLFDGVDPAPAEDA